MASLLKQSFVNVSQIFTVSKEQLQQKINSLNKARIKHISAGIELVIESRDIYCAFHMSETQFIDLIQKSLEPMAYGL